MARIVGLSKQQERPREINFNSWYSLEDLGNIYLCDWDEVPESSKGVIKVKQKMLVRGDALDDADGQEEIVFNFYSGMFIHNSSGTNTRHKEFKILLDKPILDLKDIYG